MYTISPSVTDSVTIGNLNFVLDLDNWRVLHIEGQIAEIITLNHASTGKDLLTLVHKEDLDILTQVYHKLEQGELVGGIRFRVNFDSKVEWLGVTPILVKNGKQKLILANVQIVTPEVENLENTLKYTNKKNSILQMLSHDLKGPLTIASSLITVLDNDQIPQANLNKIEAISEIIGQAMEMITNLVDKEFLDTVEAPLVRKRVDIVKKLSEYIEQCRQSEYISGKTFDLISQHDYVSLRLDEAKFMQVVNNLITNSLKFTTAHGHISITITEHEEHVTIIFSDNGIGIPQALQPYLFDRYTIAKRVGLNGEPTTGLGLFIVKEILNWHGATINCQSIEGEGTSFIINFPKRLGDLDF